MVHDLFPFIQKSISNTLSENILSPDVATQLWASEIFLSLLFSKAISRLSVHAGYSSPSIKKLWKGFIPSLNCQPRSDFVSLKRHHNFKTFIACCIWNCTQAQNKLCDVAWSLNEGCHQALQWKTGYCPFCSLCSLHIHFWLISSSLPVFAGLILTDYLTAFFLPVMLWFAKVAVQYFPLRFGLLPGPDLLAVFVDPTWIKILGLTPCQFCQCWNAATLLSSFSVSMVFLIVNTFMQLCFLLSNLTKSQLNTDLFLNMQKYWLA